MKLPLKASQRGTRFDSERWRWFQLGNLKNESLELRHVSHQSRRCHRPPKGPSHSRFQPNHKCLLVVRTSPLHRTEFNHRKQWIEDWIRQFAGYFGIDVLAYSVMPNHHHQLFLYRPDVVATWSDDEVASVWMMICLKRKDATGQSKTSTKSELDQIRKNPERLKEIRSRLSDVSWWVRLLNQRIAQRCNREDGKIGRFFQDRFKESGHRSSFGIGIRGGCGFELDPGDQCIDSHHYKRAFQRMNL